MIETEKIKESVIKLKEETNNENDDINNTEERINFSTDIKRNQIYTDNLKETQEEITSTLSFVSGHETNKESYNNLISTNLITQSAKKECNYENYINHLCNVIDVDIVTTGENFIKDILISYPIIKGKSVTASDGNVTFQITTGENEIKCLEGNCDDNRGLSVIDFRACETLLRNKYHISENVSLIYFKMESISNNVYERNIQYEIYEPFNKTKLDLSICQNVSIDIYIPIELSEKTQRLYDSLKQSGYDLFNINDPFYLQICTPYKTENGTDVLLEDRKNNYYYSSINETTCQANCHNSKYDPDSKYLKCEYGISDEEMNMTDYKKFVPKKFYNTFYDILKYSNYKVLWCYKLVFHIDSVTINKGSIIIIIFFFLYLISFIRYLKNGITPLKIDMMKKIFDKSLKDKNTKKVITFENQIIKDEKNKKNKKKDFLSRNDKGEVDKDKFRNQSLMKAETSKTIPKINFVKKNKNYEPPRKSKSNVQKNKKRETDKSKSKQVKTTAFTNKTNINKKINNNNDYNTMITEKMKINTKTGRKSSKFDKKLNDRQSEDLKLCTGSEDKNNKLKYDNFELNNMEYEEALLEDKRSMIRSYWSIINREHLILLTFFSRNDFNLSYVKFSRFIFLISTEMTMNAYFFADETMHKIYLSYGKYDFVQHIAQILMTMIFSQITEVFICYLSLTDSSIYEIKELKRNNKDKDNKEYYAEVFDILEKVNKKIKIFFTFTFIVMIFYWYSVACFCAVYRNTQIIFLKDCGISFLTELLEPFILYLIPSILRAISLKCNGCSCVYKLSEMIPIF